MSDLDDLQGGHVAYETLADLAEGLLSAQRAAEVRAHLSGCPSCRRRQEDLAAVGEALARIPPPPVPRPVADRIAATLAAESAARRGGEATPSPAGARPRGASGRRRWLPLAAAAAALVAVVGGGIAVVRSTTQTPGAAQSRAASPQEAGREGGQVTPGRDTTVYATGVDYTAQELPAQVARLLPSQIVPQGGQLSTRATPRQSVSATLAGCLDRLAARIGAQPLVVDQAAYEGRPATVVVFPAGSGYQVLVVGPRCSAGADDLIARRDIPR